MNDVTSIPLTSQSTSSFPANNAGPIDQSTPANNDQLSAKGLDTEQQKMFDWSEARLHLDRLIKEWDTEIEDTDTRRKTRDVDIDVEGLRQKGDLDEDETIIPVRVIDTNIQRELPAYINYLKNSRRLMTFRSLDVPNEDPQLIEQEFTRGMTYCGWEIPHFKELDGASTHGWACIEVVFDTSKPLNVALEYVAHDELFWPRTVKNIQDSPRIIRMYDLTITKLKEWVRDFGFNGDQVLILSNKIRETQKENEALKVYKLFFKKEGVVYVAWFSIHDALTDWLKAPAPAYIGIDEQVTQMINVPVPSVDPITGAPTTINTQQPTTKWVSSPLRSYPVFKLPYRETEKPRAIDNKGRVELDENKQEAQTAILSGFVNGVTRASNIYASPTNEDGSGSSIKEIEDLILRGGRVLSRPLNFWSPPYPHPETIGALEYLGTANSEETNQVNFAVNNRQDSRKTAREINAAQQQQTLLDSVQLTLFSTHVREIYSFAWLIVQSQALQNQISFLLTQTGSNPDGSPTFQNNTKLIAQRWELRSAGDVDVIQRQEKIQMMSMDWPIISATPLALRFLSDLLKLKYPDVGDQYAQILMAGNPIVLLGALATIVEGILKQHPDILQTINPQERQQLMQIIQMAQQMSAQVTQQGQGSGGSNQQQQKPQQQPPGNRTPPNHPNNQTTNNNEQVSQNI